MGNKRLFEFIECLSFLIYFIILFRKSGAVGAGIFGAAMIFYYFVYVIFIECVGNTLTRLVAARLHRGFKDNAKRIFGYVMLYTFLAGALMIIIFLTMSGTFSNSLFKNGCVGSVMTFLGVLFFIHAFSNNIRCYYVGCGGHIIMTIADIAFSILLPLAAIFGIDLFTEYGTKVAALKNNDIMVGVYAAIGAVLFIALVMLIRLLILTVGIRSLIRQEHYSFNEVRSKDGFKTFMRSFLPEYAKSLRTKIFPVITVFMCLMVFTRVNFSLGGVEDEIYTRLGYIVGPGISLLLFTVKLTGGYISLVYGKLRVSYKKEDRKGLISRYNAFAKNTFIVIFPAFVFMLVFSKAVCTGVFACQAEEAFSLGLIAAFCFLFMAFDGFFDAGLRATGYDLVAFFGNIAGFLVALMYILLSGKSGVKPTFFLVALLLGFITAMLIHGFYALSYIGIKYYDFVAKAVKVLIAIAPVFVIELILVKVITMNPLIIVISVLIGYVIYWTVFVLVRGLNQKEIGNLQGTFVFYPFRFIAGLFHVR